MRVLEKEHLQTNLNKSLQIIRQFDSIIDAYVLDFYVDDHWTKLPASWQSHLETLPPEYLSVLLTDNEISQHTIWPLTLLTLRQLLQDLCISRKLIKKEPLSQSSLLQHPKLKQNFTKGVKAKKRHEIQRMATICGSVYAATPVDFVVDFGAGLGHLARALCYGFGIRVCCLEMQNALNTQARVIDSEFEANVIKYAVSINSTPFQRPTHVTLKLTAEMLPHEFLATISEAMQMPNNNFTFGIVGLHPCGDLSVVLMRMFLNCSQAKFLNFVGCCHMKLTTGALQSTRTPKHSYPLSNYLRPLAEFSRLSYEAREISCHASEMYCERLASGDYEHLKVHSFRAATERILIKQWPEMRHCGLRSVKHTPGMLFEDYFNKAVQGIIPNNVNLSMLQISATKSYLLHWKRIVIFYTLRLMFAPLVESIILYDRLLFLQENHCKVEIDAIFDPRISPRNHIISAVKSS